MSVVYASLLPPNLNGDADIEAQKKRLENGMGLDLPNGVVARVVELGPTADEKEEFMHRTPSLDFAAVLSGEGTHLYKLFAAFACCCYTAVAPLTIN